MPDTIATRTERLDQARKAVQDHPMCAELVDSGAYFTVYYPAGDFPTHGIRCHRSAGGLVKALRVMERHWLSSYP